ncbi:receptor-like serine/threonine-protein kinase SD1-8 isoform X3 [Phragmites australis]|uniref:receptor-like serine/threonine-protein kinase SD1-8 isoform X3 n=1 Tax=Phragmites australis TaxID=29695 RepID=UPI002D778480|nr:receptor-like serine/threonine-protein kinase SD1-8 isoform X3 [Phragmites australis]
MQKAALVVAVVLLAAAFAQPQQLSTTLKGNSDDSLTAGQSLLSGQTLVSAQGIFELGFFSNGDNAYLGIWYKYMTPRTIIWVANRDYPINGGNASLTLSASSLDLLDRRQNKVWSSGSLDINSPQARLLDSGNLIISDTVSGNPNPLWQGFDQPCDTLLPGMRIGYDTSTNHNWKLRSWMTDSDPSPGNYYLSLDPKRLPDVLLFNGTVLIYRIGTWNGQGFSGLPALKGTSELAFNMTVGEGSAYYSFKSLDNSVLWRFVVSPDAHAHRWHSNQRNEWVEYWHLPQDQCDAYAYCGPNAACYNGDCKCLQEFVPKSPSDWSQRNYVGGCVRDVVLSCSARNGFAHLSHVKVPDTLNATMVRGKSWDDCKKLCLRNCSCSAYTIFGDSDCVVWSGDLVDIVQLTEGINDLYIRVSHSNPSHTGRNISIIVSVSVVGVVMVISALLGFCYCRSQQKHSPLAHEVFGTGHEHAPGSKIVSPLEQNLDLDAIKVATNNFAEQNSIVSSRSRTIYKGILPNFGDLAVKRLNMEVGLEELKNEVRMLARLDHPNIIRMLGSCIGNSEMVICYEYMPGGSLDAVLFAEDEKIGVPEWSSRFRIMQGICEGLLYLHEHCRIVHRDIDPSNILLSGGFIPKISDFGLAILLAQGQSEGKAEKFRGTRGYSAPELFYGKYSAKSDVYSFGVVLLEIVTGCKATSFSIEDADDLLTYVRQHWTQGTSDQLKDPRMGEAPRGEIERCIHIAVRCVQDDPLVRPTVSYIKNTLAAIRSVP